MKRVQFTVNVRNKLSEIAGDMDCCTAVNNMSSAEREYIQKAIYNIVNYIDERNK